MTHTHTYAVLEISASAMSEITEKLLSAGYQDQFSRDDDGILLIDMHGIAVKGLQYPKWRLSINRVHLLFGLSTTRIVKAKQ